MFIVQKSAIYKLHLLRLKPLKCHSHSLGSAGTIGSIGLTENRMASGSEIFLGASLGASAGMVSGALSTPALTSGYSQQVVTGTDTLMQSVKSFGSSFSLPSQMDLGK